MILSLLYVADTKFVDMNTMTCCFYKHSLGNKQPKNMEKQT